MGEWVSREKGGERREEREIGGLYWRDGQLRGWGVQGECEYDDGMNIHSVSLRV